MSDRAYSKADIFFDIRALPLLVLEMLLEECSSDRRSTNPKEQRQSTTTHVFDRPPILDLTTNPYDGLSSPYVQISAILPTRLFFGSGGDLRHLGVRLFIPSIAIRSGGAYSR